MQPKRDAEDNREPQQKRQRLEEGAGPRREPQAEDGISPFTEVDTTHLQLDKVPVFRQTVPAPRPSAPARPQGPPPIPGGPVGGPARRANTSLQHLAALADSIKDSATGFESLGSRRESHQRPVGSASVPGSQMHRQPSDTQDVSIQALLQQMLQQSQQMDVASHPGRPTTILPQGPAGGPSNNLGGQSEPSDPKSLLKALHDFKRLNSRHFEGPQRPASGGPALPAPQRSLAQTLQTAASAEKLDDATVMTIIGTALKSLDSQRLQGIMDRLLGAWSQCKTSFETNKQQSISKGPAPAGIRRSTSPTRAISAAGISQPIRPGLQVAPRLGGGSPGPPTGPLAGPPVGLRGAVSEGVARPLAPPMVSTIDAAVQQAMQQHMSQVLTGMSEYVRGVVEGLQGTIEGLTQRMKEDIERTIHTRDARMEAMMQQMVNKALGIELVDAPTTGPVPPPVPASLQPWRPPPLLMVPSDYVAGQESEEAVRLTVQRPNASQSDISTLDVPSSPQHALGDLPFVPGRSIVIPWTSLRAEARVAARTNTARQQQLQVPQVAAATTPISPPAQGHVQHIPTSQAQ